MIKVTHKLKHRRQREKKTDYHHKLRMLKGEKLRFVVRKSSNNIICQIIKYDKGMDFTINAADSKQLKKFGWLAGTGNLPAAYLTGLLCGTRMKEKTAALTLSFSKKESLNGKKNALQIQLDTNKEIDNAIKTLSLDIGLYSSVKGSRLYAALKGFLDAGINVPHSPEILPTKERISGKHIADYAAKLKKENASKYKNMFAVYLKNKIEPENLPAHFEQVKKKILAQGTTKKK